MPPQKPGRSKQELTGRTFGRVVVRTFSYRDGHSKDHYLCECSCGNTKIIQGRSLLEGKTRSCGCLRDEVARLPKPNRRLPNEGGKKHQLFLSIKRRAKHRNLDFSITESDFTLLAFSNCHYCGSKPSNVFTAKNGDKLEYGGVDRIDSELGYVNGNVRPCCAICNRAKSDLSLSEFSEWISRITKYQSQ